MDINIKSKINTISFSISLILSQLILAAPSRMALAEEDHQHQKQHEVEPIRVFGSDKKSSLFESVMATTKKSAEELQQKGKSSLGSAIGDTPGVNSTDFNPTSTRPIIRGLGGERVLILIDELGTLDVSGLSGDHVVPINILAVDSVEIVRGPISLLYGSSAIGGVVNIVSSRRHNEFYSGLSSSLGMQFQSVNNFSNYVGKLDYGFSDWMFHFDGSINQNQDLKVPTAENKIKNSQAEQNSFNFSSTYFLNDKQDYVQASFSNYNNLYGVVTEDNVTIDTQQNRADFFTKNKINLLNFKTFQTKTAVSQYGHTEFEGTDVGTVFKKNSVESRLELLDQKSEKRSGISGLHLKYNDLSVNGAEAFLPSSKDYSLAGFTFKEYQINAKTLFSTGARIDFSGLSPNENSLFVNLEDKNYVLASGSAGMTYKIKNNLSSSLNFSFNQRNPNATELFANGAHIATGIYEVGNKNLNVENSFGLDLGLKFKNKDLGSELHVFANRFTNFVSLNNTGNIDDTDESGTAGDSDDDFPIYNYVSSAALLYGAEYVLESPLYVQNLFLELSSDVLYGKNLKDDTNIPRLTPPRVKLALKHKHKHILSHLELQQVFKATRLAPNETETDGYLVVNLGNSFNLKKEATQFRVYWQIQNLFNAEARNHSSVNKNLMQMGSTNFLGGVEAYF